MKRCSRPTFAPAALQHAWPLRIIRFPRSRMNAKKKVLMSSTTTSIRQIPGRQEQLSTRIVFFIAGFGMAAWAPLVPFAKIRANIDDGLLGLLLLCLGVGSIVAMPLAGALAARLGCRLVIALSTGLMCLSLPFLATVSTIPHLVCRLLREEKTTELSY